MTSYKELLRQVKAFAFDIDGVFTDGIIFPYAEDLLRGLNAKDGFAVQYAIKKGYKVFIITGGKSPFVKETLEDLGVTEVHLASSNKLAVYTDIKNRYNLNDEDFVYMGDDLPDYQVMKQVGVAVCPQDAVEEIKRISHYQSPLVGGRGCVRDIIEQTLRVQDHWFHEEAFTW